jgi:hypothetical protein
LTKKGRKSLTAKRTGEDVKRDLVVVAAQGNNDNFRNYQADIAD